MTEKKKRKTSVKPQETEMDFQMYSHGKERYVRNIPQGITQLHIIQNTSVN